MFRLLLFFFGLAGLALAGEYVVFASGSRMRIDRHEIEGAKVRLFAGDAQSEVDFSQVLGFEAEEFPPVKPAALASPESAQRQAQLTPRELADQAADKYGLPRNLLRSMMAAESGFRHDAVSPKGAIGLMQLMPATAQSLGADPRDPAQNVDAGARYIHNLLLKYEGRLWHALAAYNAGPAAVDRYKGVPPYRETVDYINRIGRDFIKQVD